MTDELENQEIWVVLGAMTWGKGDDFKEAFTNWFRHASSSAVPCEVSVHRFEGAFDPKQVSVDDFGRLEFPKVAKWAKIEKYPVTKKMSDTYHAWSWLVEEIEYGPVFDKAFAE